ncbi:hypothetical protein OIU85_007316 [Salix viminalis]|uniref:Zinc finger LSD1-type domain-containing protein n=1 Tax=Salix viminalis TaxID=40686 RepID=A0A9Q0SNS6_SALVM|nr:hypothetical protein OIU85_007316 [Salix viminalis]
MAPQDLVRVMAQQLIWHQISYTESTTPTTSSNRIWFSRVHAICDQRLLNLTNNAVYLGLEPSSYVVQSQPHHSRKEKEMAIENCSRCGVQLVVPQDAQTIRCAVCQAITRVHSYYPLAQARESATRFTSGLISMVSSNISGMTGSVSSSSYPVPGYGGYYAQPPIRPVLQLPLPSMHGRKRALLCGVSYRGKSYKIKGKH